MNDGIIHFLDHLFYTINFFSFFKFDYSVYATHILYIFIYFKIHLLI